MGGIGTPPPSVAVKLNILTGLITSPAGVNVNIVPGAAGITKIGTGTPGNLGTPTNNDAYIKGRLEVDGGVYFDGSGYSITTAAGINAKQAIYFSIGDYFLGVTDALRVAIYGNQTQLNWGISKTYCNHAFNITALANYIKNHDHAAQDNPTLFIHSVTDPDTDNTQWISRTHDQTGGVDKVGNGGHVLAPYSGSIYLTNLAKQAKNFGLHTFHTTVTLATDSDTTSIGLTPVGVVVGAAIRVSTEIAGLDSADHHVKLGVAGTVAKYCDASQGGASTSVSVNKKAKFNGAEVESAALILTIDGGSDNTPSAGAVEVEIHYLAQGDIPDA